MPKAASASGYYDEILSKFREAIIANRTQEPIVYPLNDGTLADRNEQNTRAFFDHQCRMLTDPKRERQSFNNFHLNLLQYSMTTNVINRGSIPVLNLYFENIETNSQNSALSSSDKCLLCNVTMHINVETGIYTCPQCCLCNDERTDIGSSGYSATKTVRPTQQSSEHIRMEQVLCSVDGSCYVNAPPETKKEILAILKPEEERLSRDISKVTVSTLRDIFKAKKKGVYYKYVPAIYCIIHQKPFIQFSTERKSLIFIIFDEIIRLWRIMYPEEVNFSHYSSVLKILFQKIGKSDYIPLLNETKNQTLKNAKNNKMKRIFDTMEEMETFKKVIEMIKKT